MQLSNNWQIYIFVYVLLCCKKRLFKMSNVTCLIDKILCFHVKDDPL